MLKMPKQFQIALTLAVTGAALVSGCSAVKPNITNSERIYFSHSMPDLRLPSNPAAPAKAPEPMSASEAISPELVIYFDNDSARVRPGDLERLQSFVMMFPLNQPPLFIITGHTDSNHSDTYNIGLSERRSRSAQTAMLTMGVPITQTALRALGESSPVAQNTTDQGRQDNRRVTVRAIY